jgi:hypothetical protein
MLSVFKPSFFKLNFLGILLEGGERERKREKGGEEERREGERERERCSYPNWVYCCCSSHVESPPKTMC